MKFFRRLPYILLLFSFLVACQSTQPTTTVAIATSADGFGGTGNKTTDEDGFGGTGLAADSGFGGTGIVGTITAFGSIWVNGIKVEYDQTTPIKSSISKNKVSLKLGQQVSLETKPHSKATIAEHITIYYPLAGKISAVNGDTIKVNGQQVYISKTTLFDKKANLIKGNYVAINALPNVKGGWNATRINTNIEKHTFYKPEPPLDFSKTVKNLIIEDTMMHHRDMMNFKNMNIHFTPLHMESLRQMHDLKDMKEGMESMKRHGFHGMRSIKDSFHK